MNKFPSDEKPVRDGLEDELRSRIEELQESSNRILTEPIPRNLKILIEKIGGAGNDKSRKTAL